MRKGDSAGRLILVGLIGCLTVVMWATRNPHSGVLERAQSWPLVGPVVESFRDRYGAPSDDKPPVAESAPATGTRRQPSPPRTMHVSRAEFVWVRSGTRLLQEANSEAAAAGSIDADVRLGVVERRGDWYRVASVGHLGWVHLPDYGAASSPPLGSEPALVKPLPGRSPDNDLLSQAVGLLDGVPAPSRLGAYRLFTDVDDAGLLRMLGGVANDVERAYSERYGVSPIDQAREVVVLYRDERAYRELQDSLGRLAGLPAVGLVSQGLVAIYAGERDRAELAATLVHELVHLLNRRALGPALPPWLDEGLADDLSYSAADPAGRLSPARLAGTVVDLGAVVLWKGGKAAALEVERSLVAGQSVPLDRLLTLDWHSFVDPEQPLHYPESAFFVRYLLESDPHLRGGFQTYLRGIAEGESVEPEALLSRLGSDWQDLETGFREWTLSRRLSRDAG